MERSEWMLPGTASHRVSKHPVSALRLLLGGYWLGGAAFCSASWLRHCAGATEQQALPGEMPGAGLPLQPAIDVCTEKLTATEIS